MGTKVQCKSYLPGYYSMRDLNEDASGNWSSYCEDKTSSGHIFNGFTLRPVNGHAEYDKEIVKRTMLEHEAIFRKQVYELHRLYRIQKDMMDELKMKESLRYSVPMDTSQSNSISSQMPFEGTKTKWQMPQVHVANTSCNGGSVGGSDDARAPLNFLKGSSVPSTTTLAENGDFVRDSRRSEPETKVLPKRMFDLQLPADMYVDNEDAERIEREDVAESSFGAMDLLKQARELEPDNNVKLTLGPGEGPSCRNVGWKSDTKSQNNRLTQSLADLNEPIQETCYEGSAGSTSACFFGTRTHVEEVQGRHMLTKSTTRPIGLYRDFFQDLHGDKMTCSNLFSAHEETRQDWQLFDNGAGPSGGASSFNSGLLNETFPMSYEVIQSKLRKAHEGLLPDHNNTETWFREKPTNSTDISGRRPHFANPNYLGPTSSQASGPCSIVPHMDFHTFASPTFSSSRMPVNGISQIPIAVQALPCFNGSTTNLQSRSSETAVRNSGGCSDKWQHKADMRLKPKYSESSSYQNGFHPPSFIFGKPNLSINGYEASYGNSDGHGSQKCFKGLQCSDIKSAKDVSLNQTLPNGFHDGYMNERDRVIHDVDGSDKESSKGLSWLQMRPVCNESADLERHASQMLFDLSQGYSQPFCSFNAVISDDQRMEGKKKDSTLRNLKDNLSTLEGKQLNLNSIVDLVLEKSVGKKPLPFRSHINLNLGVPDSSETSLEDEANGLMPPRIPSIPVKTVPKIDLEAPIASQVEENVHPRAQSITKTDELWETESSHVTLTRVAAENIISLSKDNNFHSDSSACHPSASVPCHADSLHWFADVVSSNAETARGSGRGSGDEGSYSFESLTLKLEETKPDEYWCRPKEPENRKDDEKSMASLLTRPRRGQARRRRQRRDFQNDILPGLASLSRHEVTEDLQAIGGLMRASGRNWQAGPARRSTGRKPRNQAVSVAEIRPAPPTPPMPIPPTNVELDKADGTSIIGWGRTTRRCRRQRCPSGNVTVPLI